MRLELPAGLFDLLVERQLARGYADDVTQSSGAVWLHTDMGPSFYLTSDGRMLVADAFDGLPPRHASSTEAHAGLVAGSRTIQSPELLSLLPPKPPDARSCPVCGGSHWAPLHRDMARADPGYFEVVCVSCRGLGWLDEPCQ